MFGSCQPSAWGTRDENVCMTRTVCRIMLLFSLSLESDTWIRDIWIRNSETEKHDVATKAVNTTNMTVPGSGHDSRPSRAIKMDQPNMD